MRNKLRTLVKIFAASCVMTQTLPAAFTDAVDNEDGTFTNWFGTFTPESGTVSDRGWINHEEHGWLYVSALTKGLWLYDPNAEEAGLGLNGWIYTSEGNFPSFFVGNGWAVFVEGVPGPAATPRVFWSYKTRGNLFLPKATTENIVEVAVGNSDFSSLVTAVSTAGLVDALSGEGPFTVFAPTNAAFGALPSDVLNDLLTNPESLGALTDILTYHVVPGRIPSGDIGLNLGSILRGEYISGYVQTLNGADLRVDVTPFGVMLNGDTMVTSPDLETSNGIIHVIDSVLLPPMDIVDTAVDAGIFNTLVAAVQAAGLESALRGDGPLTVFAPTDDAFTALPEGTVEALLDNTTLLSQILLYHVVGDKVYSSEVMAGEVPMLSGDNAMISMDEEGNLMIDGAKIVVTDIQASNGVIHVIDAVIQP